MKTNQILILTATFMISAGIAALFAFNGGYTRGLKDGYDRGFDSGANKAISWSLDTVKTLLNRKVVNENTIIKLSVINPDTVTYSISIKYFKP